jgi:hypothetical protein
MGGKQVETYESMITPRNVSDRQSYSCLLYRWRGWTRPMRSYTMGTGRARRTTRRGRRLTNSDDD